jgi:hypothetical protein
VHGSHGFDFPGYQVGSVVLRGRVSSCFTRCPGTDRPPVSVRYTVLDFLPCHKMQLLTAQALNVVAHLVKLGPVGSSSGFDPGVHSGILRGGRCRVSKLKGQCQEKVVDVRPFSEDHYISHSSPSDIFRILYHF